jgi:hypothetical protein
MPAHAPGVSGKLSAAVISYNRAAVIGTCLRALGFADEVVVIDKSSTDATPQIAACHADRVVTVPWTPTVEETRAFAIEQCAHDWILCLDDDECLSPGSGSVIRAELAAPRADIIYLPLRHYILGIHDEAAYYWPEHHPRLFRRDAVAFTGTVHGGIKFRSDRILHLPPDSGVAIHHLSHRDVAEWVEKCNRYTSRPDRQRATHEGQDLASFAHARIDHWLGRTRDREPAGYPSAAALLRAVYDIVDRLKTWEEEHALDGAAAFARLCAELDAAYAAPPDSAPRAAALTHAAPRPLLSAPDAGRASFTAHIAGLRAQRDASVADVVRWASEAIRLDVALADKAQRLASTEQALEHTERALDHTEQALTATQRRLGEIEASTSWRATAALRLVAEHAKHMARRWLKAGEKTAAAHWSE